jgi:hypothetical protein
VGCSEGRGPRAADIAEVAGAPDMALHVLGVGVPQLVLVPGLGGHPGGFPLVVPNTVGQRFVPSVSTR